MSLQSDVPPARLRPSQTFDVSQCETTPIHLTTSIQPFGVLMVLHGPNFRLVQVSETLEPLLGIPVDHALNQPLASVLGAPLADPLTQLYTPDATVAVPAREVSLTHPVSQVVQRFEVRMTVQEPDLCLLEWLPQQTPREADPLAFDVSRLLQALSPCQTLAEFADILARQLRQATGYDRVLVYQFHEDWHGEVIAEDQAEGITERFLGCHFPATDIPQPARALYLKAPARLIHAIEAPASPLVPDLNPITQAPLDLSRVALRGVAPSHALYLGSMGVAGSLSISITLDGRLWGLVVCHSLQPQPEAPVQALRLAELLGPIVSLQLKAMNAQAAWQAHLQQMARLSQLVVRLPGGPSKLAERLAERLFHGPASVPELFQLDSVLLRLDPDTAEDRHWGTLPDPCWTEAILRWLHRHRRQDEVVLLDRMAEVLPYLPGRHGLLTEAAPTEPVDPIGGFLYLPLCDKGHTFLLGFRQPQIQTIPWLTQLTEAALPSEAIPLGMAHSFRRWQQSIRGCSAPWTGVDQAFAETLQQALVVALDPIA